MKRLNHIALLIAISLLFPLLAFASNKNQHSVSINDSVKVGSTQLKPGDYKVEWQGTGPAVQVTFMHNGNTVATAPATLRTNDDQAIQDDVVIDRTNANTEALKEIDFAHQKEALVFAQGGK
jgi:hypothetical protein